MFQHKAVHLQTWYNPKASDSTQHQIDHIMFRRRDIKAVQDTRVYRGADIESDHRLMVCKLRLKFRKPAKHTFHPRLQPAPLRSEAGQKAFQVSVQDLLATHHHIPIREVEHSWDSLKSSLNTTAQAQLKQPSKPQRPWITEATLHLADCKRKLWQAWLAKPTPELKAEYKAASRAAHKSALVDQNQHFSCLLTKVQNSMRKGDTHPAYKCLNQLSKPKCRPGRQLRHGISGRPLHTAAERTAEWLLHVTQLYTATTAIAPEVLAQPNHPLIPQQTSRTQKSRWMRLSQPSNASRTTRLQGSATSCQKC